MHVTVIIAAAGEGRRLGAAVPKQLLEIEGQSILERSVSAFTSHQRISDVIVVLPPSLAAAPPDWMVADTIRVVAGGSRRQDSVANAFDRVLPESDVILVHDAARPFVSSDLISRSIDAAAEHGAAIAALPASDTVKRVAGEGSQTVIVETIPRVSVYLAQTPQAFRREILSAAVALGRAGVEATDEAMLAEQAGHRVHVVEGDPANVKITTARDVEGRPLILGGVTIPSETGATGHSDADVVCHAIIDAVLGAVCAGNVGQHYPDTDPRWQGASSIQMVRDSVRLIHARGFAIENVDVTVVLERPKIAPFIDQIRAGLAEALGIAADHVSVKGKTNEGVDAVGRGEAIAAHAVALVSRTPAQST